MAFAHPLTGAGDCREVRRRSIYDFCGEHNSFDSLHSGRFDSHACSATGVLNETGTSILTYSIQHIEEDGDQRPSFADLAVSLATTDDDVSREPVTFPTAGGLIAQSKVIPLSQEETAALFPDITDTDSVTVIDATEEHMLGQRFYRGAGNRPFTREQEVQSMPSQMSPRKVFPLLTPTKPFSVAKLSEPTHAVDKALSILDENIPLETSDIEPFTSPPTDAPITSTHIAGDEAPLSTPTMSIEMSQSSSVTSQSTPKATPHLSQERRLQEFVFFTPVSRKLRTLYL